MFIKLFYKKSGISHIVNIVLSVLPFCHCQNMMQTSCPAICFPFQIISMIKKKVTSDISIFQISFLHILKYFFGFQFFSQLLLLSYFRCHGSAHTIVGFPELRGKNIHLFLYHHV